MTSNYDGEISGLMERIQQIRDQRSNIIKGSSAVQPIIVEQLDSKDDHYSEDSSAGSETDSPGSGEFDQLSMHQHDSLFAIVPEVTPKQVSVFSIADFMASVPSAPVAVKQQPSETHQPEKYHENSSSGENVQGQNYDAHREYFQQDANSRETEQPSNLTNNLHDTKGRETMGGLNHHLETPESVRSDGGDETRDMTTASQVVETEMDYYVRESSQLESLTREGSVSSGRSEPSVAHPVVYSHQHHGLSAAAVVDLNKAQDDVVSNPSAAKAIDESSLEAETTEEVEASEYNTQVKGYVPDELVDNMSMHPTTANMIDDESGSNHPGAWNVPAVSTTARKEGSRRNKEALSDKSNAPAAPPSRRGSSSRSLSPRKPGGAGAVLRHSSPPSPSSQDRSNVRSQQRRQHQQEEGEHEREASRSEISSKQDPNAGEANEGEQGEEYALERRRKNSPPRPRSRSPPKPTAAAHPSSSAGASGSGSANSGGSKHRCKTKDITHTHSTLAQASGYRISVSGELDALVQYKASLAMQSQLVDKLLQAKSALLDAIPGEQCMRRQMTVDITTEMLQKSVLDSELLSCIVLGGTSTQAPAMQDHLSSQQKSSQSRSTPHSAHARHSPHSAHTSHHQQQQQQQHRTLSSWQLRSASPTDSVSSASGSGSVISYPSVIGGKRTDQLRRSPSGAINSMPLTGALKRGAALGSTTVKSIGTPVVSGTRRSMTAGGINTAGTGAGGPRSARGSRSIGNPAGSRTLFPSSPQVSVDALRRNAMLVHSLVGNIDNYCSCCRTKLVDVTNSKNTSMKHSHCRYCIHSH